MYNDYNTKLCECYRKRAKSVNGGGPGKIMCKTYSNGCECFASYVKHEAGQPTLQGFSQEWFDAVEARVEPNIGAYLEKTKSSKIKKTHPLSVHRIAGLGASAAAGWFTRREGGIVPRFEKMPWSICVAPLHR